MNLPKATIQKILGITTCLAVGVWLIMLTITEVQEKNLVSTSHPFGSRVNVKTLQEQLSALYDRLGQFEKNQQQMLALSKRLAQLEQKHQSLIQQLKQDSINPQVIAGLDSETAGLMDEQSVVASGKKEKYDIERFEESFWQEGEDPTWSRETENIMLSALEQLQVPDTVLDSVQCQQSACQVEFVHPKNSGDDYFIETVHASEAFSSEFYAESTVDEDGRHRTLVYLARPGHSLFSSHNP